jgi:hypothetical protein
MGAERSCIILKEHLEWIKIEKYIPYSESIVPFTVTLSSHLKNVEVGGGAELFWSVSGTVLTYTTMLAQLKRLV